jgi:WD40 repeat protein
VVASGTQALFVQVSATPAAVYRSRFAASAVEADFDPSGESVAIVNKEGSGVLVRFSPASAAAEIPLGAGTLTSLTFNRAGDALIGVSGRGELWLFDPATGAQRGWDGRRGRDQAVAACFAGDPERVVVVTLGGAIESIDADKLDQSAFEVRAQTRPIKGAYFSPDRRSVLLAFDDAGAEWIDLTDGTVAQPPLAAGAVVVHAAFAADSSRVFLAANDGHARLWSRNSADPAGVAGQAVGAAAAALSSDATRIATGTKEGDLEIWDGTLAARLWKNERAHSRAITRVAVHPELRSVASASEDRSARVWRLDTGERIADLEGHTDAVDFVSYSRDGTLIVTASRDGTARLWESRTGAPVKTFRIPDQFLDPIHAFNLNHHAALTADGRRLVTVTAGDFMMVFQPGLVWDVHEGTLLHALAHEGAIYHISLEAGDRWALTTSYDTTAKLWDLESGHLLRTFSGHEAPVITGVVYANGKLLATAAQDFTARIWDVQSGRQIAVLPHDEAAVTAVALDDGERVLATVATDGYLRVWSSRTGNCLCALKAGDSPLVEGWFMRGAARFVSRAKDGDLRVWQLPPRGQALIDHARARVQHEGGAALTREQRIRFFLESP